jgi:hypothetical protein
MRCASWNWLRLPKAEKGCGTKDGNSVAANAGSTS